MSDVLHTICAAKQAHVAERKAERPLSTLEREIQELAPPRGFIRNIIASKNRPALIAEIKKASPSGGLIRPDFDPAGLAREYADSGAACLSVLTDVPFFQGADINVRLAREASALPVLRKDFIIDPYQIHESRAIGADCILLIMACLSDAQAREFHEIARSHDLDVLVEVHDRDELDRALALGPEMIGINNRNLKTLEVRLETSLSLRPLIPDGIVSVAESGIASHGDVLSLAQARFQAMLVGESLMKQTHLGTAVRKLFGES